jgi:hypothetical protein
MTHHARNSTALLLASMWALVAACDADAELEPTASLEAHGAASVVVEDDVTLAAETKAEGAAKAEVALQLEPASFDLEAVAVMVEEGELESAAELEVIINDAERGYNRIDIDADGEIDHVQVVEVEDAEVEAELAAEVVFELRVVPSRSHSLEAGVTFATVSFARHPVNSEVEIRAGFTEVVHQPEVRVYTRVVPVRIEAGLLVGGSVFLSWLYAVERPVYVGVYEVDDRGHWIPPGHVKHGHWKATGHTSTRGGVHGHGKTKGKADGRLVVEVRRGTTSGGKIERGGSSKSHESHGRDEHGSGGSSKSKGGKGSSGKGGKGK